MKVSYLDKVIKNHMDEDSNLDPGNYNVTYHGIFTMLPEFRRFDGIEWEDVTEEFMNRDMLVFARAGD